MNEIVSSDLVTLAEEIRNEHQACLSTMRQGVEHALKVGELLVQARELVKHGEWEEWVRTNCNFTSRHAWNYMQIASRGTAWKPEIISEMTLSNALLSANSQINDEELRKKNIAVTWKEHQERWKLENEDNQVKEYLDALNVFAKAVREVVPVAEFGKFSPEGASFTIRRHEQLRKELERLEGVFKKVLIGEG